MGMEYNHIRNVVSAYPLGDRVHPKGEQGKQRIGVRSAPNPIVFIWFYGFKKTRTMDSKDAPAQIVAECEDEETNSIGTCENKWNDG